MQFDQMGKPGDQRAFLHKTVFNIAKAVVRTGVSVVAQPFIAPFQAASLAFQQANQPRAVQLPAGGPRFQQRGGIASRTTTRIGPAGVLGSRTTTRFKARAQAERFQGVRGSVSLQGPSAGGGFCPTQRGTHINRSGYFVQAQPGNPDAGGIWIAKGSVEVPNRSRNAGNGRAVVRATSRIASFDRLARRVRKQMKAACR